MLLSRAAAASASSHAHVHDGQYHHPTNSPILRSSVGTEYHAQPPCSSAPGGAT
jgi:hypothetical protein